MLEVNVVDLAKPRRVRPSSLQLAELCALSSRLSVEYPTSHDVTRFGSAVDIQVSAIAKGIATGDLAGLPSDEDILPETEKIIDWLERNYPIDQWEYHVQERVELLDPETGELLTAGTPDLLCLHRTKPLLVDIDWKKSGQMYAGHLKAPAENLQQLAYLTAAWLKLSETRKIERAKIVLAFWDLKGVHPREADITEDALTDVVVRVRDVPMVDLDKPRPEASVGEHCDHCYQRMHCHAHLLPAAIATQAGLPAEYEEFIDKEGKPIPLTAETAVRALTWMEKAKRVLAGAKKIYELVEGNADAYTIQNGAVVVGEMAYGPLPVKGRRAGATVATLEAEGLERLIREPAEGKFKCKWYKAG